MGCVFTKDCNPLAKAALTMAELKLGLENRNNSWRFRQVPKLLDFFRRRLRVGNQQRLLRRNFCECLPVGVPPTSRKDDPVLLGKDLLSHWLLVIQGHNQPVGRLELRQEVLPHNLSNQVAELVIS